MKDTSDHMLQAISIICVTALCLAVLIWQIFRATADMKQDPKSKEGADTI
jgi:hypothetical protein